jgi:hypothetical protein
MPPTNVSGTHIGAQQSAWEVCSTAREALTRAQNRRQRTHAVEEATRQEYQ